MYRQGDLLIRKIEVLPLGLKEDKTGVLVYGEVTGHKHRLVKGRVLKAKNGDIYMDVKNRTEIVH